MSRPQITEHNSVTGNSVTRDMTDDEYQALLDTGWTPGEAESSDE